MRHWVCLWKAGCGGGAYILCRLPTPPCRYSEGAFLLGCLPPLSLAYFLAPIPPTPFPAGRGKPRLFHARGFAPCIPGAGRDAALGLLVESGLWRGACPGGTGAWWALMRPARGLLSCLPAKPAFSFLSCPHPPDPLPLRGRGRLRLSHARGFAPCIPGAGWDAALGLLVESGLRRGACPGGTGAWWALMRPAGGLAFFAACRLRLAGAQWGLAFSVACRRCL